MQHFNLDAIPIDPNPRPNEIAPLSEKHQKELAYLGRIAQEKKFAASLIVNLYNSDICGADMYHLSAYCRGESSDTLKNGMMFLIQLCGHIESHEIYGSAFVESLIEQWEFRKTGKA
ncbi:MULTISPECIES: hypothetical protein [Pectobacterium]|uniref:hypothetical protein n=1 Tax=Pectobacterium TaxID=122277 RepID=UPI000504838F|nr:MULTISPECIES: hypothetical protein [Pectobacterium]AZS59319.1 hypothetical protein C5E18_24705 [Pectobacterium parmentieri]KFX11060.1 hypothetical protein JV34_21695 [Pectobacterium atrosepticum]KMK87617.1 hypothetical protein KCQ_05236 [Pectobacterium atrosepticum ICMP 1526]QXE13097.1 hypothetical protein DCX48_00475 [Pectobacterium atrosepticum]